MSCTNVMTCQFQKLATLEKSLFHVNTDVAVYVAQQQPELQALVTEVALFSKR